MSEVLWELTPGDLGAYYSCLVAVIVAQNQRAIAYRHIDICDIHVEGFLKVMKGRWEGQTG